MFKKIRILKIRSQKSQYRNASDLTKMMTLTRIVYVWSYFAHHIHVWAKIFIMSQLKHGKGLKISDIVKKCLVRNNSDILFHSIFFNFFKHRALFQWRRCNFHMDNRIILRGLYCYRYRCFYIIVRNIDSWK